MSQIEIQQPCRKHQSQQDYGRRTRCRGQWIRYQRWASKSGLFNSIVLDATVNQSTMFKYKLSGLDFSLFHRLSDKYFSQSYEEMCNFTKLSIFQCDSNLSFIELFTIITFERIYYTRYKDV